MEIAALIISLLALAFSFYTHFMFDRKIKRQQKLLNEQQLERNAKEAEEEKKADIFARMLKHGPTRRSIMVVNKGKTTAQNVIVHFEQNLPEIHIFRDLIPVDIPSGEFAQIYFDVSKGAPDQMELYIQWEDDFSHENERTQTIQL